ncbi:MAG: hypothetical protein KC621_31735 [Myxococcales bacterium]|nr:hypothetical protein [Myxococcales bacterium]
MSQLPPTPEGCDVEVAHDGIVWRSRTSPARWAGLVFALALASALVALGVFLGAWIGVVGVLFAALAGLVAVQSGRRSEVRIDDRQLVVEDIGLFGTRTERIAMADLRSLEVVERPDDLGPGWLVARTRTERLVVGQGQSPEVVAWLHAALLLAIDGQARRAEAEGREYPFLRTAPEQLKALAREPEPPT